MNTRDLNREAHQRSRDPAVIREFARRRRNARRGLMVCASALGVTIAIGILASVFLSEFARVVTLVSVFTAAAIVFLVTIPIINSNYNCPACGERPIRPTYEVRWFQDSDLPFFDRVTECENCGAALE